MYTQVKQYGVRGKIFETDSLILHTSVANG